MTAPVLEVHLSDSDAADALQHDVRVGLSADPKWLPPKWFYDARGSELFEEITALPEYYPTRTERELLRRSAEQIAARAAVDTLVELGSGSSEKTRLLLDALAATGTLQRYVPLDVSESALRGAMAAVAREYPALAVHGVVGDFTEHLELLPPSQGGRRLVAFLGGTIGNLLPVERARFFAAVRAALDPGELMLLGAGLVTDPAVMVPAYDDAAGVTAEFNRNVLWVLNRELGRLRRRCVRSRRGVERPPRADRNVAASPPRDDRTVARSWYDGALRRWRADAHRNLCEVPAH
jgi:L-histidine N-alpha-methyltransferase